MDWRTASWVDERDRPHPLEFIPKEEFVRTTLTKTVLRPGETARLDLIPDSKRYRIDYRCTQDADYREPLVPFDYRGRSEAAVRKTMQDMLSSTTRVHLTVPLTSVGKTTTVRFSWRVRSMLDLDEPPRDWGVFSE
jgi:hypothetical protein